MIVPLHVKADIIRAQFSGTRRVMRFGMLIHLILAIIKKIKMNNTSGPVKMLFWQITQYLFLCAFLVLDHAIFFTMTGFTKAWDLAKIQAVTWWAIVAWLLSCICEIIV